MFIESEISLGLKALSNSVRIAMLKELMTCKNCINVELVDKFPLSQSTISQHPEVLAKAKLIKIKRQGKKSEYCINGKIFRAQLNKEKVFADSLAVNIF